MGLLRRSLHPVDLAESLARMAGAAALTVMGTTAMRACVVIGGSNSRAGQAQLDDMARYARELRVNPGLAKQSLRNLGVLAKLGKSRLFIRL